LYVFIIFILFIFECIFFFSCVSLDPKQFLFISPFLLYLFRPNGRIFGVTAENIPLPRPKIGDVVTFSYDRYSPFYLLCFICFILSPSLLSFCLCILAVLHAENYLWIRRYVELGMTFSGKKPFLYLKKCISPLVRSFYCHLTSLIIFIYVFLFSIIYLSLSSGGTKGFTTKPSGHWTHKNMRLSLEKLAKNRGMDPLLAETWYNTPRGEIEKMAVRKFMHF